MHPPRRTYHRRGRRPVLRMRQLRDRSRATAAQAAIVLVQATRATQAASDALSGSGERGTASGHDHAADRRPNPDRGQNLTRLVGACSTGGRLINSSQGRQPPACAARRPTANCLMLNPGYAAAISFVVGHCIQPCFCAVGIDYAVVLLIAISALRGRVRIAVSVGCRRGGVIRCRRNGSLLLSVVDDHRTPYHVTAPQRFEVVVDVVELDRVYGVFDQTLVGE